MTVLWVASSVTVANGSALVTVNTSEDVTKIETSATFHGVGFSLPYEIKRVYNDGSSDIIELYEPWAGSNGTIEAVAAPSGASVTRAADSLASLQAVYEALADSVSTTATANSIPQRDNNGRMKAAPASASDDVVVKSQTGTAASKDVTTSRYDTATGRLLKSGDVGLLSSSAPNAAEFNAADDLDLLTSGGFWSFGSASNGKPYNGGGSLIVAPITTDRTLQIGNEHNNSNIGFRYRSEFGDYPGAFSPWYDFYHSGNTNFNVFGGNGADDRIAFGVCRNTVTAFIHFHINSNSAATGFSATGTFKLVDSAGLTTIATGLTNSDFALSNVRPSNRLLSLLVTFPTASVVKDTPVYLETESSDAKIEVTF